MATLPDAIAGARIVGERFVHSQRQQNPKNPEGRMPFMDHIRELRNRVVKMALALVAGMTVGFVFFNQAWYVVERPLCATAIRGHSGCRTLGVNELVLNGPLDAFYLRVKVALIVGVILSSPVWLYQIWAFVAPGLHAREKRWSCLFLGAAIPLFGIGITLCYLSLGRSLRYLLGLTPGGDLPAGARIGTGSPRWAAQLLALRGDLGCVPIRGNANTRLGTVHAGDLDGVVLARAGPDRIECLHAVTQVFEPGEMLPAPGQGALAVECRASDGLPLYGLGSGSAAR